MNKSERKMRLQMIKAISDRKKVEKESERLKKIIIKMACCGNCIGLRVTPEDLYFCYDLDDLPSERMCDQWHLKR